MPPEFIYNWPETGMFLFLLAGAAAIAGVIDLALRFAGRHSELEALRELSPVIQTICGTLFVLAASFLASGVWQTEDRARDYVNAEARGLRTMKVLAASLPETVETELSPALKAYALHVEAEWEAMEFEGGSPEAEASLDRLLTLVVREPAIAGLVLPELESVSRARQGRLNIAQEFVSAGKWTVVLSLSALLLVSVGLCHAHASRARLIAMSVVSAAVAISLFVILAHDRPFQGVYGIRPGEIIAAAADVQ
jgi:hypothetical protein